MAWGSHSEKEMIIGKVIFEISRKNDVHNNYETDYTVVLFSFMSVLSTCNIEDSQINHKRLPKISLFRRNINFTAN